MAILRQNMSEPHTTAARNESRKVHCEFLYGSHGAIAPGFTMRAHSHPFWQLEIVHDGMMEAFVEDRRYTVQVGDLILIAPGGRHRFSFPTGAHIASPKFNVPGLMPAVSALRTPASRMTRVLGTALLDALVVTDVSAQEGNTVLGDLTTAILHLMLESDGEEEGRPTSTLAERVEEIVLSREGKPVSIAEIASALGYSVGYVSDAFRTVTGQPLKQYIDQQRANVAARLLTYSGRSVTEIADRLGFPDPFTFSKFCTRTLGRSPTAYRRMRHRAE